MYPKVNISTVFCKWWRLIKNSDVLCIFSKFSNILNVVSLLTSEIKDLPPLSALQLYIIAACILYISIVLIHSRHKKPDIQAPFQSLKQTKKKLSIETVANISLAINKSCPTKLCPHSCGWILEKQYYVISCQNQPVWITLANNNNNK